MLFPLLVTAALPPSPTTRAVITALFPPETHTNKPASLVTVTNYNLDLLLQLILPTIFQGANQYCCIKTLIVYSLFQLFLHMISSRGKRC